MARTPREAIVIILDIGESVATQKCENGKTFLANSCSCVSMILQRKLFNNKADLLALFTLSSNTTNNSLDYPNIELMFPMTRASWGMLEYVENSVKPTNKQGDWLDSLIVAMQYLKDETDGSVTPFSGKKLLLLTNFTAATDQDEDDVGQVINGLKALDIELFVIGPQFLSQLSETEAKDDVKSTPAPGESLATRILHEVGGTQASFTSALSQLQYFETRKVKPAPWNTVMDIGPDIKIAVTGYKMISPATLPQWRVFSDTGVIGQTNRSHHKQDAAQSGVHLNELIPGYMFGATIVPFSGADEASMQYISGSRCLSIVGFTKATLIRPQLLAGVGVQYITARQGDDAAATAMSALIHSLHIQGSVGIARKVYNTNNAPVMGALMPEISDDCECLIFIELPFSEDIQQYVFPSLRNNKPSVAQLASIDSLIDSMDLMEANTDENGDCYESFQSKDSLNVYHQRFYQALCDRGLHPEAPLPPVQQFVLDMLVSPYQQDVAAQAALQDVMQHFPLVEIERKEVRRTAADIFNRELHDEPAVPATTTTTTTTTIAPGATTMADITSRTVLQVGSTDPIGDFNTLLATGHSFESVGQLMSARITDIIMKSFGCDDFAKAARGLAALRDQCVLRNSAALFNNMISQLKHDILERGKRAFWEHVTTAGLGLITSAECPVSCFDLSAAAEFLKLPENPTVPIEEHQMDVDDLLNDM